MSFCSTPTVFPQTKPQISCLVKPYRRELKPWLCYKLFGLVLGIGQGDFLFQYFSTGLAAVPAHAGVGTVYTWGYVCLMVVEEYLSKI